MQAGEAGGGEIGDHTNSSLRLMRWLLDYGELMRCARRLLRLHACGAVRKQHQSMSQVAVCSLEHL